jgi:hypothetical protein
MKDLRSTCLYTDPVRTYILEERTADMGFAFKTGNRVSGFSQQTGCCTSGNTESDYDRVFL